MDSIHVLKDSLKDSLPKRQLDNAEKDLMSDFKASALSITTLYKSSLHTSKVAYNEGYRECLKDVLTFVQAGLSAEGEMGGGVDGGGMTIGRVMDWVEARFEATKAREEEEEEDREKERERGRYHQQRANMTFNATTHDNSSPKKSKSKRGSGNESKSGSDRDERDREREQERERHALADIRHTSVNQSPSPPPVPPSPPMQTRSKQLSRSKTSPFIPSIQFPTSPDSSSPFSLGTLPSSAFPLITVPSHSPSAISSNLNSPPVSMLPPFPPIIGSKRRHAAIVESIPPSLPSSSRDRTISQGSANSRRRNRGRNGSSTGFGAGEPMEIEDERERKRQARR